jgi:hypothetical protein
MGKDRNHAFSHRERVAEGRVRGNSRNCTNQKTEEHQMTIQRTLTLLSILLLTACGGGGGSGGDSAPATATTVIKGVASKGLITDGTVNIFALNSDGSKGAQLGTGTTDASGAYTISCGSYSGPVVVEASGNYLDEATGQTKTVPASAPLRAALPNVSGTVSLPVTPLTDLAVRQAGTALTAQNIAAANSRISDVFKIDVIATIPAAPTATAFQASTTTQAQKDYSLILAAVSQQMSTNNADLATTLTTINSGISSTGMNAQTAATITAAATTFVTTNLNNQTSVTTMTGSTLQTIGSTTQKLTLALQGNAAATVNGIQATITLPSGASVRAATSGALSAGVITASSTANALIEGAYKPVTSTTSATVLIGLISARNLSAGDLLVLNVDLAAGTAAPPASTYVITTSTLVAADGTVVNGASLALH